MAITDMFGNPDLIQLDAMTAKFNTRDERQAGLDRWANSARKLWGMSKDILQTAPQSAGLKAYMAVSMKFIETAHEAFDIAVNMLVGTLTMSRPYIMGVKDADMVIRGELQDSDDGGFKEFLHFTYGGVYLGYVARLTGKAGAGGALHMGLEVYSAPGLSEERVSA